MPESDEQRPQGSAVVKASLFVALEAHRRGEADAIEQLLTACQARLKRLAHHLLQSHPEIRDGFGDTVDVVQEASLRLWRALREIQPESELHLMRLAAVQVRRQVIDLSRKYRGPRSPVAGRRSNVVDRNGQKVQVVEEAVDSGEGPTTLDDWTRLHAAFAGLPVRLRDPVKLRLYLGASVAEIATMLNCDRRTVERRLNEAYAQAKAAVQSG